VRASYRMQNKLHGVAAVSRDQAVLKINQPHLAVHAYTAASSI